MSPSLLMDRDGAFADDSNPAKSKPRSRRKTSAETEEESAKRRCTPSSLCALTAVAAYLIDVVQQV